MPLRRITAWELTILLGLLSSSVSAIEFTLNQRQTAVLTSEQLMAHTVPDSTVDGGHTVLLSSLFPWMESVDYIEMQSGLKWIHWDFSRLELNHWNAVKLVHSEDQWEIISGHDIFLEPERVAVYGTVLGVQAVKIWLSIDNEDFRNDMEAILALRGIEAQWRKTRQPAHLLSEPPQDGLPHLILLKDMDVIRSISQLISYRPVFSESTQWQTTSLGSFHREVNPWPFAMKLREAETSLHWLLAENPVLFDKDGQLPGVLSSILGVQASKTDTAMDTALSSVESVNVLRTSYAAIPTGLSPHDSKIANLVLHDAVRFYRSPNTIQTLPIPIDPRTLRYFDAYTRIGLLALSGQMEAVEAAHLINSYVIQE